MSRVLSYGAVVLALLGAVVNLSAQGKDKPITADEALKRLKEGNARFASDKPNEREVDTRKRVELADGQQPIAAVLSCADSRVVDKAIFDQGLGNLFTLRVAGNISGPSMLASMEYAVGELKVPLIVVLGHTRCGAVGAAVSGKELPSANLKHLVDLIHTGPLPKDLKDPKVKEKAVDDAVRANVLYQARSLTKDSSILKDFVSSKRVRIVPAVYSLKTGEVEWLELTDK
ncbi:MAG: carbonic anhydrase [Gemmataceae bacterium]|nr:carbonic anhydrase [Gemmataceae bacterium]